MVFVSMTSFLVDKLHLFVFEFVVALVVSYVNDVKYSRVIFGALNAELMILDKMKKKKSQVIAYACIAYVV